MIDEVFEAPARWRAAQIRRLRLTGEERRAAASPGPALPHLLEFATRAVATAPPGVGVDIGAGLGGVTDWLTETTGRWWVPIDPSLPSCRGAADLFGDLSPLCAEARALPLPDRSVAAVMFSGVISLVDELAPALAELARVLVPDGTVVVSDLVSSTDADQVVGVNRFRSLESIVDALDRAGMTVFEVAVGALDAGDWAEMGDVVAREVARRHRDDPGFEEWVEDRRHLAGVADRGLVLAGGAAARRRP